MQLKQCNTAALCHLLEGYHGTAAIVEMGCITVDNTIKVLQKDLRRHQTGIAELETENEELKNDVEKSRSHIKTLANQLSRHLEDCEKDSDSENHDADEDDVVDEQDSVEEDELEVKHLYTSVLATSDPSLLDITQYIHAKGGDRLPEAQPTLKDITDQHLEEKVIEKFGHLMKNIRAAQRKRTKASDSTSLDTIKASICDPSDDGDAPGAVQAPLSTNQQCGITPAQCQSRQKVKWEVRICKRTQLPEDHEWRKAKYDSAFRLTMISDDEDEYNEAGEKTHCYISHHPAWRSDLLQVLLDEIDQITDPKPVMKLTIYNEPQHIAISGTTWGDTEDPEVLEDKKRKHKEYIEDIKCKKTKQNEAASSEKSKQKSKKNRKSKKKKTEASWSREDNHNEDQDEQQENNNEDDEDDDQPVQKWLCGGDPDRTVWLVAMRSK
ncbi:hypothetical protein NEOLEDRAFT_1183026 [Neolentinus lepideus HHB14362 ss-1]|uniref:Uncharacterized protein n=1 Tax=Neolentinus lepideus HHB14362 ss-1 TaxID=1314782 RepID=A0A165NMB6_9AGAM|nr:hypothetical protein NEOLEDRAFT_1183026 [Neolentinus lepideus HHB14362 ss-1]